MNTFTEATTPYWQGLLPANSSLQRAPWRHGYPARLPDGRSLMLPIRPLKHEPSHAVASLLINQASFEVADTLADMLAQQLQPLQPELVIGLPTLGLTLAPAVARHLGHTRFVPLGYSRKFWYEEALSAPVQSITSPGAVKTIYLDPHLLPLLRGKRVVIVDDAVSTGSTALGPWGLIESLGAQVLAFGVAMRQGTRWQQTLGPERASQVVGVFDSPLLRLTDEGWVERVVPSPCQGEG
jgi:adenine/guanine phosphoribosyltransferase-like PRPP-binding protein